MQHVFNVKVGDKMPAVMNTEIIVEDEKIIEIPQLIKRYYW